MSPTIPWTRLPNKHCFAHRLPSAAAPAKHASLVVAQSECRDDPNCGGVYKPLGLSDGGKGAYFLCDTRPFDGSAEGGQVWGKPRGMAPEKATSVGKRKPGQAQAGKWCSNWCCCAPGWHGEACGDADECVSRPCQNGGACAESSSTYLVNDYFRKYRCECAQGHDGKPRFRGHNCADAVPAAGDMKCRMDEFGAKSANASTSTFYAYKQFQVALEFTGITLKSSDANFNRMCKDIYESHERGGVCGQQFVLHNNAGAVIATPVVNCCAKGTTCTSAAKGKGRPELYAVMSLCSTPCMLDPKSTCCFVPAEVAWQFPCCRSLSCCPDQQGEGVDAGGGVSGHKKRRALGRRPDGFALSAPPPPRALPAVSVSVSVEEASSSMTTYESTMQCLSSPTAACLKTHKLTHVGTRTDATLGRRHLQALSIAKHPPACRNGGSAVTCDDGVRNGNEAMADCGGGCTRNQAKQCAAEAAKAVASLTASGTARPGKFEVLLPGDNITAAWGRGSPSTLSVRARQKLVITCVASVRPRTQLAHHPRRHGSLLLARMSAVRKLAARDSSFKNSHKY